MRGAVLWVALLGVACDEPVAPRDPSVAITPLSLPAVELERADRRPVTLGEGRVLLHFWATWCAPCRRELPGLFALAGELRGARVIAVTSEDWAQIRAHFGEDGVPPWVARDPDGALSRALGVDGLPDTYLVDPGGVARRRVPGTLDWTDAAVASWVRSWALGRPPPGESRAP